MNNPLITTILMYGAIGAIFYFVLLRPQQKQRKEHDTMLRSLRKGDEIVTTGGIAGRIEDVGDTFLTVEIAAGMRVKVQKGSVLQVLPKGALKSA